MLFPSLRFSVHLSFPPLCLNPFLYSCYVSLFIKSCSGLFPFKPAGYVLSYIIDSIPIASAIFVVIQDGWRTGRKIPVKLACKRFSHPVLTSKESPILLVQLFRTRRCPVLNEQLHLFLYQVFLLKVLPVNWNYFVRILAVPEPLTRILMV